MQVEAKPVEKEREFLCGFKLAFEQLSCPKCKRIMNLDYVFIGSWPYVHADVCLTCKKCGNRLLFGVPEDPVRGMELIIWDSQPQKVLKLALMSPKPICPLHDTYMTLTKIWGDKTLERGQVRLQWKCPKCFLTYHRTVNGE